MIRNCPISNYTIKRKDAWSFTSKNGEYKIVISIIGDNVIQIESHGYNSLETSKDVFHNVENIISKEFQGRKYFIIYNYKHFKGADTNVRKNYTKWLKDNSDQILAVYFFNTSAKTQVLLKTAKLFLKQYEYFFVKKNYNETIKSIILINSSLMEGQAKASYKGETCPISGYPITQKKHWIFSANEGKYGIEISTIGENIYLVKNKGYASIDIASKIWPKLFSVVDNEIAYKKYFLVHDYSEYKGADSAVRHNYIKWLKKNKDSIISIYFYGTSPYTRILLNAGKLLLTDFKDSYVLDSYKEVINAILIKQKELGIIDNLNSTITNSVISNKDWEKGDVFEYKNKTHTINGKWIDSYKKVTIITYLLDENIFLRKYFGELYENIIAFSKESFGIILLETNIEHYHFYTQFDSNAKISVKYRKHGVAWFNENYQNIITGGFFNLSFTNKVVVQIAKTFMYHKEFKKRIFIIDNIEDILDSIEQYNLKHESNISFEDSLNKLTKEELYHTAIQLHNEKEDAAKIQSSEIQELFNKLGTISWNEDYDYESEALDTRGNAFSDLHNAVLLIQRDIQEILQKRDNLIKKAKESDHLKSTFLANMSHEIRTPLNGILGFSNIISSEDLDNETIKKYANIIAGNGNNLLNLINDIIDISKIETNQISIKNEPLILAELIDSTFNTFNTPSAINKNKVELILDNQISQSVTILSDNLRIQQILNNLINNALKFTTNGHVKLTAKITENTVSIAIEDTGIGIDEKKQKLIFERFRQEDENTDRDYGGSGLGLAISKSLSHLLGGDIYLSSEKNKGSIFELRLPYNPIG